MRIQSHIQTGMITAFVAAVAVSVGASQMKSSFESGDFSGWNAQGKGWSVYSKAASDGEKSAMCLVNKGESVGLKACAKTVSKAEPGFIVKVDLDVAGKAKARNSNAKVSVICVDRAGNILKEVEKKVSLATSKFIKVSVPELMVPSGTVETYLMLMVEVSQPSKGKEWWRFDNVVIQVK